LTDPPTVEQFREIIFEAVGDIAATLAPDADWAPVLLIDSPDGFAVCPLTDPTTGKSFTGQDSIPEVTALITKMKARMVGRVGMGWAADQIPGDDTRPTDRDDRQEILIVQIARPQSKQEVWIAEVERNPEQPPKLGEWSVMSDSGGPIAEALQMAVDISGRYN
jgi:hypothetical protein